MKFKFSNFTDSVKLSTYDVYDIIYTHLKKTSTITQKAHLTDTLVNLYHAIAAQIISTTPKGHYTTLDLRTLNHYVFLTIQTQLDLFQLIQILTSTNLVDYQPNSHTQNTLDIRLTYKEFNRPTMFYEGHQL